MHRPGCRALTALVLVLSALGALLVLPQPAGAAPVEIQLLTINDFHGRLEPPTETDDEPPRPVGGAAQLAGLVDQLRADGPTSFVAAGDNIGASTFVSAIDDDNPTIDALGEMGLDAAAVGNHEFDKGLADLLDRVIPRATFPYLGGNVYMGGQRVLAPYAIVDVGGIDVGYVGTVTQETASLVSPGGIVGVEFRDPVAETEAVAADLKDGDPANGEADVVVAVTHEGADPANIGSAAALAADPVFGAFVAMSGNVDAIISGHTHVPYAFDVPIPGTDRTRPVLEAASYGTTLGRIAMTVDGATGAISASTASLIDVVGAPEDPAVAQIVADAVATSAVLGAEPVGSITADITRAGDPPGEDRGSESTLGNFIADVQLAGTADPGRGDADIAFMNPGGLREDLLVEGDGVITYAEAFEVQPFANEVVTKTFTGAQIKDVLEEQWQPAGASRPVLWLGVSEGLTYTYDPGAPQGYRINEGSLMLDGTAIDPAATYRVTMNGFLASGGDNFTTLGEGTDPVTTGDLDLTMLTDYLEASSPVTADPEPRSFVAIPEDPDLAPFSSVQAAVGQQFDDFDRIPTPAERLGWEVGIYDGSRTLEQLIVELQTVGLATPEATVNRLYLALFARPADATGLAYWVDELAAGRSRLSVAQYFTRSPEFIGLYGQVDDPGFVDLLYQNILGRSPSDEDRAYWVDQLSRRSRAFVFLFFAESAENRGRTASSLAVLDLVGRMVARVPSRVELALLVSWLDTGQGSLTELVHSMRVTQEYAARVTPT